jgi:carboxyl-terminal processing protease
MEATMPSSARASRRVLLPFLVVTLLFAGGTLAGGLVAWSAHAAGASPYPAWDTLARAFHAVRTRYVDDIDETKLVYAALEGMTVALDPHTTFVEPKAYEAIREQDRKRYFGIGIQVVEDPLGLRITGVVPKGPADLAGLRAGDRVLSVDGQALASLGLERAAQALDGPRGKAMRVEVQREDAVLSFRLVRDLVNLPAVRGGLHGPGQAYIAIEEFRQGSGDEFREMLRALARENKAPLQSVILDVRDNPGGILTEAVAVVDAFVGDAIVAQVQDRSGKATETYRSRTEPDDISLAIAVLVNGGSASGSEIVAGALRDLAGARLVGLTTYGKGSVQTWWEFEDRSALKLTIGRYLLPRGERIEAGRGLVPDLEVPDAAESARRQLVDRLRAETQAAAGLRDADRAEIQRFLDQMRPTLTGMDIEMRLASERRGDDPQLSAAVDLLATR